MHQGAVKDRRAATAGLRRLLYLNVRTKTNTSIRIDCRKNINELNFMKQIMHNVLKAAVFSAMLLTVAAGYAQTKRYPYVQDGKIIVCREGTNGVKSSLIHANWTSTPIHNEKDAANRFAAKFQVADSEASEVGGGTEAANYCSSGWRLPTVRELSLMYALRDELTAVGQFANGATGRLPVLPIRIIIFRHRFRHRSDTRPLSYSILRSSCAVYQRPVAFRGHFE